MTVPAAAVSALSARRQRRAAAGPPNRKVEAAAGVFLGVLALIMIQNAANGTLRPWLAAKFLNRGETAPASSGPMLTWVTPASDAAGGAGPPRRFADPLPSGRTISVFGDPRDGGARSHAGIDIAAAIGTPVYAIGPGTVRYATENASATCGRGVSIEQGDGWRTVYCHLSGETVTAGEAVVAGQVVGYVGATGNAIPSNPHLHFELRHNDTPVDPAPYIGR